jgi:predicted Rossmann fold flavoprotein
MERRILIVGAGASGLVAAWRAASRGCLVTVLDGNRGPGAKLRLTGGGRCNLTHGGSPEAVLAAFPAPQARFLRTAFRQFSPADLRALLDRMGLATEVRPDGRVFPGGGATAAQVVEILAGLAREAGADLRLGCRVAGLEVCDGRVEALRLAEGGRMTGSAFLLACGGASYPETGSRGEALAWLEALGCPTVPWRPALAPIPLLEAHPEWEGVPLRGGRLRLSAQPGTRCLREAEGDLVFTREGLSGPAALALSEATEVARRGGGAWLVYQPRGAEGRALEAELVWLQASNPHLAARTWLRHWLPERIGPWVLAQVGLSPDQRMRDLPRAPRKALAAHTAALPLGPPRPVSLARGEVAAGGLSLGAVDPGTCRVRAWENLWVCGELLDVHGPVGGYNLQAAFSTGYLAGESIAGGCDQG